MISVGKTGLKKALQNNKLIATVMVYSRLEKEQGSFSFGDNSKGLLMV
jgi:hypothetical protein